MLKTVLVIQGCFVIAEKYLHRVKACSAPHSSEEAASAQEVVMGYNWDS